MVKEIDEDKEARALGNRGNPFIVSFSVWVNGFISGTGYAGHTPLRKTDSAAIYAYIEKYCRENPLDAVVDAASQLLVELSKNSK
ncbi:MAG: hypothetical protein HQK85_10330 [Nitrospinae bacterium]|nr:hypothetical protein [Nitrospinota bacterium]